MNNRADSSKQSATLDNSRHHRHQDSSGAMQQRTIDLTQTQNLNSNPTAGGARVNDMVTNQIIQRLLLGNSRVTTLEEQQQQQQHQQNTSPIVQSMSSHNVTNMVLHALRQNASSVQSGSFAQRPIDLTQTQNLNALRGDLRLLQNFNPTAGVPRVSVNDIVTNQIIQRLLLGNSQQQEQHTATTMTTLEEQQHQQNTNPVVRLLRAIQAASRPNNQVSAVNLNEFSSTASESSQNNFPFGGNCASVAGSSSIDLLNFNASNSAGAALEIDRLKNNNHRLAQKLLLAQTHSRNSSVPTGPTNTKSNASSTIAHNTSIASRNNTDIINTTSQQILMQQLLSSGLDPASQALPSSTITITPHQNTATTDNIILNSIATAHNDDNATAQSQEDIRWEEQFDSLCKFHSKTGHCKVPSRCKIDPTLG